MSSENIRPSESDKRFAEAITHALLQDIEQEYPQVLLEKSEIFTADVEAAVQRFRTIFHSPVRRFGWPCFLLNEQRCAPIDLISVGSSTGFGWAWPESERRPPLVWRLFGKRPLAEDFFKRFQGRIVVRSREEVFEFFRSSLFTFLTVRASARQSDISQTPGIQFQVHTQNRGLRIHYSPAYFFNSQNVFGSPSSPVNGWIQPGRYVFGGQGPSDPEPIFDPAEFDIPPLSIAQLMVV